MSSVTSIVDLKPFKTSWTIKVKVIRLWKQTTGGGGETIDMVLCDVKVWMFVLKNITHVRFLWMFKILNHVQFKKSQLHCLTLRKARVLS